MAQLLEPTTLSVVLEKYSRDERLCIGPSFPHYHEDVCDREYETANPDFGAALEELKGLLHAGIGNQDCDLIHKLKSIAHAFLCSDHQDPHSIAQFAYYWLASNNLPKLLDNIWSEDGSASESSDNEEEFPVNYWTHRRPENIAELSPTELWVLHQTVQHLDGGWLQVEVKREGGILRFSSELQAQLKAVSRNIAGRIELGAAKKQWAAWHCGLTATSQAQGTFVQTDLCHVEIPMSINSEDDSENSAGGSSDNKMESTDGSQDGSVDPYVSEPKPTGEVSNHHLRPGPSTLQPTYLAASFSTPNSALPKHTGYRSAPAVVQRRRTPNSPAPTTVSRFSMPRTLVSCNSRTSNAIPATNSRHISRQPGYTKSTIPDGPLISMSPGVVDRNVPAFPDFQPIPNRKPTSARGVAHNVFEIMEKDLDNKKKLDKGYIYILRIPQRPGYVKIGRTTSAIERRRNRINACFPYDLEIFNDDDRCKVSNHTRVEALVHAELKDYRRCFLCPCQRKVQGKLHDCDDDKMTQHSEWFHIDEAKAIKVVLRWRRWISTDPYCDGILRPSEQTRVDYYSESADRMKAMSITNNDGTESWDWDRFMHSSPWSFRTSWIHDKLYGPRFERLNYSRWVSLWKHWQSNLIFCLIIFLLPRVLSVVSYLLPARLASNEALAFADSAILGTCAILYAA